MEAFETALRQDATEKQGQDVIWTTPEGFRGAVVLLLHYRRAPVEVFRGALDACWSKEHGVLTATVTSRATLKAMFKRAAFQIPGSSDVVRVWRGTSNCPSLRACRGLSWTTDRAIACWFATQHRKGLGSKPLVLRMDAPRAAFFYHSDERQEAEMLCFDAISYEPAVDGDPTEWLKTGQQLEAERVAERLAGR